MIRAYDDTMIRWDDSTRIRRYEEEKVPPYASLHFKPPTKPGGSTVHLSSHIMTPHDLTNDLPYDRPQARHWQGEGVAWPYGGMEGIVCKHYQKLYDGSRR